MGRHGAVAPDADDREGELSLREAARRYDVAPQTLRNRVRRGEIPAYKARGMWGLEWRVSGPWLEASGLHLRPVAPEGDDPRVARLQADLDALRRKLAAERDRADEADRRLGYAMLEGGRLRSALEKARRHCEGCAVGSPRRPRA